MRTRYGFPKPLGFLNTFGFPNPLGNPNPLGFPNPLGNPERSHCHRVPSCAKSHRLPSEITLPFDVGAIVPASTLEPCLTPFT